MIVLIVALALFLAGAMTLAWWLATRTGNHGWVDTIWSLSTGLAAIAAALVPIDGAGPQLRALVVAGLAAIWAGRLGSHILVRTLKGQDDPRYAALRREWGADADRRLFFFLQSQAVAGFILALVALVTARNPQPFGTAWDMVGLGLAAVALGGEALADRQLARFRADPTNKGRICDAGLWGLSRHPNYFFEWLGWLAYPLLAISLSGAWPWGFLALAGPVMMYALLVHVSGIPPTERHMEATRGAAFRAYQRRVNAFWPGPPKH